MSKSKQHARGREQLRRRVEYACHILEVSGHIIHTSIQIDHLMECRNRVSTINIKQHRNG
eukprot:snap_masked-scaffold_6-processed-gene-12.30-mRNA-1 protein AED:1.00 eAED:1.00 QI:0/0/0/0/1/1/2/0/59